STGLRRAASRADAHPLLGVEVLIVGEEVFDLLKYDRGQVLPLTDVGIIWQRRIDRYADQFLIATMLVLKIKNTDGTSAHDAARDEGRASNYQRVERIAIRRKRMRHEAVVRRIAHRRMKD